MNETAVDWLFQKLWDNPKDKFTWQMILQEAKKKEKRQIIDSHLEGWSNAYDYLLNETNEEARQAEDYYNETYEKK